jgi:hypothetical protein
MATIVAGANGNWSGTGESTPWIGGVPPGANDIAQSGNYMIAIDQNITCVELQSTGVTTGGFTCAAARVITAKITKISGTSSALLCTHTSGLVELSKDITAKGTPAVRNDGVGGLSISGCNISGGDTTNAHGVWTQVGYAQITNCVLIPGSAGNCSAYYYQSSTATPSTITGCTCAGSTAVATAHGIYANGTNPLTITNTTIHGGVGFGSFGLRCIHASAAIAIVGCAIDGGHTSGGHGINNESTGAITIDSTSTITGGTAVLCHGVYNQSTGTVTISGTLINTTTSGAIAGQIRYTPGPANYIEIPYDNTAGHVYRYAKTIPAASVLQGVNGDGSTVPATGTYHAPEDYEVISGAVFGPLSAIPGNVTKPLEVFVLNGIDYGAYGTQYHGALPLPAEAQVLKNISYGPGSGLTGQLEPGGGALVGPSALISG